MSQSEAKMAPISEFDYRKIKLFEPKLPHFFFRSKDYQN